MNCTIASKFFENKKNPDTPFEYTGIFRKAKMETIRDTPPIAKS